MILLLLVQISGQNMSWMIEINFALDNFDEWISNYDKEEKRTFGKNYCKISIIIHIAI